MNADRIIHTFAGALVLASLALAHWHSPYWLCLTFVVGLNLFQSGLTNWCLGTQILVKLGVSKDGACGLKG
ncbi:MAG: hypothetical protein H6Q00_1447 [Holophagaceae bacterium]|nr:hypothetical protein [Holophagaceae bacterium]